MVAGDIVVDIHNSDDIVAARKAGHQLALDLGFSLTDVTMIATAISEIARNITSYAGRGAVRVTVAEREGRQALVVRPASPTSSGRWRTGTPPVAGWGWACRAPAA
jgi:serine/threonine-protein kinase RsbT